MNIKDFYNEMYIVCVNNTYIDITNNDLESNKLDNFDISKVSVVFKPINVNRWHRCNNSIEDIVTNESITYDSANIDKTIQLLNKIDIERERAEAKIRALNL